jgi:isoaspartyl peptidase/L-asparaginase-like protein (Ntn-hydrolase superfamily)
MNGERIIQIVIAELSLENLKLQDSLEAAINNNETIVDKVKTIKEILGLIAVNEASLTKFQTLVSDTNQKNENGKI